MYSVGFVLSGGGARGFTHLGVIEALDEMGIKPDIISGVSAGSIVGAFIAKNYKPIEILDIIVKNKFIYYFRPVWKGMGFLEMNNMVTFCKKYFPEDNFKDLSVPLIVTATDIINCESIFFSKGELIRPLMASSSIPLVFNPMEINNTLLADGGILNNFPVEPLKGKCKKIIGLHCNKLDNLIRSNSKMAIIERSFHIAVFNTVKSKIKQCDVFIEPADSGHYSMFDISNAQKLFDIGYDFTMNMRKEIKKKIVAG